MRTPTADQAQSPLEQLTEMNERVGKTRKKSAKPRDPTKKVERWYRNQLKSLVRAMARAVEEEVIPVVKAEKADYRVKDEAPLDRIERAASEASTEPTQAEIESGNYRKGKCSLHGLLVTIENPRGSIRKGTDANGREWSVKMPHHYGYLRRTEGNDGDAVDVFLGPEPEAQTAYIIDQVDPNTGAFDEHKIMLGFSDEESARAGYLGAYEEGWQGLGELTSVSLPALRAWLNRADLTRPAAGNIPEPLTGDSALPTMDAWADRIIAALSSVSQQWVQGFTEQYERMARRTVSMAEAESTDAFVKSVNEAVGVDMSAMLQQEGMEDYVEAATKQNAQLIKSIPERFFAGIESAVLGGVRGGDAPTKIAQRIREQSGVSRRKAELIARDQTSKLTSEITERRQKQAGIKYFQWVTSKDERVGDDHRRAAKRDVGFGPGIYRWDRPPPEGVPGNSTRPNCRCVAVPRFEHEIKKAK